MALLSFLDKNKDKNKTLTKEPAKQTTQKVDKATISKKPTTTEKKQTTTSQQNNKPKDKYQEVKSLSKQNLKEKENNYKSALNDYNKKRNTLIKEAGIKTQASFESTQNKKISYQTKKQDAEQTKQQPFSLVEVNKKLKNEMKKVDSALNDYDYAKYVDNEVKAQTKKNTLLDKTLGVPVRAVGDIFSPLVNSRKYINSQGQEVFLPSYSEIRQREVSNSYDDSALGKVGKFVNDAGYNLAKIGTAGAIDLATAGIGGKALYWTDMATDNYKNAINEGYDKKQAAANTVLNTASEFVTEKLLGGLSKTLTGGQTSELSSLIGKAVQKGIKNPKVAQVLSNASAEGIEEFLQEFIGAVNDKFTLGKEISPSIIEDAIYSGLVGAATGGLASSVGPVDESFQPKEVNISKEDSEILNKALENGDITEEQAVQVVQEMAKIQEENAKQEVSNDNNLNNNGDTNTINKQQQEIEEYKRENKALTEEEANVQNEEYQKTLNQLEEPTSKEQKLENPTNEGTYKGVDNKTSKEIVNSLNDTLPILSDNTAKNLSKKIVELSKKENLTLNDVYKEISKNYSKDFVKGKNESIANAKQDLRNTRLKITPELKSQMADGYRDYLNRSRGKLRLNSSEGMEIDSVYQEMYEKYPELFSEKMTNPKDQLDQLIEISNMDTKQVEAIEKANLKDIYNASLDIYEEIKAAREDEDLKVREKEENSYLKDFRKNTTAEPKKNMPVDYGKTQENIEKVNNIELNENKAENPELVLDDKGKEVFKDDVVKILTKEGIKGRNKTALKDRVSDFIKNAKDTFYETRRMFVDSAEVIDRLEKTLRKNGIKSRLRAKFNIMGTSRAIANYDIGVAQTNFEGDSFKNFKDSNGNDTSMSYRGIWQEANNEVGTEDFSRYLMLFRNLDEIKKRTEFENKKQLFERQLKKLDKQSSEYKTLLNEYKNLKETGFQIFDLDENNTLAEIKELENKHKDIKRIANNLWTFYGNMRQQSVDSGLISKEMKKTLDEQGPHYVRMQRDVNGNQNQTSVYGDNVNVKNGIQRMKENQYNILPLEDTGAEYIANMTKAQYMNRFSNELEKVLNTSQEIEGNAVIDGMGNGFDNDYVDPIEVLNDDGNYTLTYYKDGKRKVAAIDSALFEAMQLNKKYEIENGKAAKLLLYLPKNLSKIQRALLTDKNPLFVITNGVKDFQDALINTKYSGVEFTKNLINAYKNIKNNSELWQKYQALGGLQNTYFDKGEVKDGKMSFWEKANSTVEQAPRFAEFLSSLEHGEDFETAMFNSAEVTTNFNRGGNVIKALNRNGWTFLNASVQGFDKMFRNFTEIENPKQAAVLFTKLCAYGIAAPMFNEIMHDDDDEYQELPDYVKDNYYVLWKNNDGRYIRIPKGRVLSIFGSAARYSREVAKGNEKAGESFNKWYKNAKNQVGPNSISDNVFSPIKAAIKNESWTGNPIVSESIQNKEHPNEEYDSKTDSFSIWLANTDAGKKLKLSPKKINYVLDQWTGVVGDIALPALSPYAETEYDNPIANATVSSLRSKFTVDPATSNKNIDKFYNEKSKIKDNATSVESTKTDVAKNSYMESASKSISELTKKQKEIEADKTISSKEKYNQTREINKEKISTMKKIMDDVKNASEERGATKIGDKYYVNGEKVNDNTVEKAKEVSMDIDDYMELKKDINDMHNIKNSKGKVIKTRKEQVIEHVNNMNLSKWQKDSIIKSICK